jgi:hypothetical protein
VLSHPKSTGPNKEPDVVTIIFTTKFNSHIQLKEHFWTEFVRRTWEKNERIKNQQNSSLCQYQTVVCILSLVLDASTPVYCRVLSSCIS